MDGCWAWCGSDVEVLCLVLCRCQSSFESWSGGDWRTSAGGCRFEGKEDMHGIRLHGVDDRLFAGLDVEEWMQVIKVDQCT